ncbi:hypothetical protein EKO27_g8320 [Xylaria grammica]|uniref:Nephrocystin 3-like N-terminal domain-containing protein n=1 Tax=Xylaria grammica TaxID=363999 RepID=A0A439CX31_9PEZI|nr:hypothetical protein EKO27_g8320 [Xylaria grammica]
MNTTNDGATSGTSGVESRSQELQYTSGAQRRSDMPAYEDVELEIRKQLQKFSSSLLEAMNPIKDLVVEVGKPAGYLVTVPEIHSIVGDLQRTIARVESSIVPKMAPDGALQPNFTYPNLVVQLEEIKSQITQAGQRFQAILQAPKHRPPRRWFRGKGWRLQIKDLKELHARVKDATSTLELLVAAITMTAALEQRNFRGTQKLNSINEALRNSLPPGHILLEEKTTVSQPAQQSPGQPVLRKVLVRRTKAAFLTDQRFDDFYHSNISISNRARHQYFRAERLEGTCDWFFGQKPWGEWISSSTCGTPSTLYCWGAPGIGKSTITSLVIDELANANRVRAFCYLGDCGVSSAESLVLSLGSQLWKSYSEVVPHDSGVYGSDHGSHISREGAAETEGNVHVRASTEKNLVLYPTNDAEMPTGALPDAPVPMSLHAKPQATFNVLLDALIQLIRRLNGEDGKVFIVIDSWDKERMEPGREHDFDALLTGVQSVGCRVFLTSRTKPHNTLQASEFVSLPIEESTSTEILRI